MKKSNIKRTAAAVLSVLFFAQLLPSFSASGETMTNDRYVYEFLTDELGLNHAAASGLMANVDQECAFVPTAYWTDINGKTSYGLMQWNGPRFEQLKSFCEMNGYGYDTLEGQLAFLEYDLTGAYSGYYNYLLNCIEDTEQGAYDAAYFWAQRYEVCRTIYFEPRANLAKDYYYPAYLEYAPVNAVDLGDDFYGVLTNSQTGLVLFDDGKAVCMAEPSGSSSEVWHFTRSGNDTYKAVNCETSRELSPDESVHLWSFYETAGGYSLQSVDTGEVLGVNGDNAPVLQIGGGSDGQSFTLTEKQPPAISSELTVNSSAAPSVTEFVWNAAEGALSYRLKIFSGSSAEGTPQRAADNLTETSYKVNLPAGSYTAVVESVNECGYFSGKPFSFTIDQQQPADLGDSFYAKISWNNSLQYLTKVNETEILSQSENFEEDQLWQFVKNEDGSYRIYADPEENALSLQEKNKAVLDENMESEQSWIIYGDEENGYIIEQQEKKIVLSAAEQSEFNGRVYADAAGQRFDITGYDFKAPELSADASGGALEPVEFSWNKADCAEKYTLNVKDENGKAVAEVKIQDNDTSADITLDAGEYSAELSAVSAVTGETAVSESTSFSVKNLPVRPSVGIDICTAPGTVSFYWNRCAGAKTYSYEIRRADTGETVAQKNNVKGFSGQERLDAGEYILTVTAENQEGRITSYDVPMTLNSSNDGSAAVSMKSILAAKKQYMAETGTIK